MMFFLSLFDSGVCMYRFNDACVRLALIRILLLRVRCICRVLIADTDANCVAHSVCRSAVWFVTAVCV